VYASVLRSKSRFHHAHYQQYGTGNEWTDVTKLFIFTFHACLANKRMWFLKKLKRAGVSQKDFVYYYDAAVRPVLEYASPVWHTQVSQQTRHTLEAVYRRACQFITGGSEYTVNCALLRLENLADRRDWQSRKLFKQITNRSGHCLHHLWPAKRDETVTSRLARTNKFKNCFICFPTFFTSSNFICYFVCLYVYVL